MVSRAGRRWYNVGVTKLPYADRDVAHSIMADPEVEFYDIIGADTADDDERFPVGADCTYSLLLTEAQAERAAAASNLRHIEEDQHLHPIETPTARTLGYMGAGFPTVAEWHGRDVTVGMLDQGTTSVLRNLKGWSLAARRFFSDVPASGELFPDQIHGCLTSSCAIPEAGRILDAIVTSSAGTAPVSSIAAAIRWVLDNGAQVINLSFGGIYNELPTVADSFTYMAGFDCEFYGAAGNDALNEISYPAAYSRNFSYVNSVEAFDETTDTRASFSNWAADATGAAPGVLVNGILPDGTERTWSGTSAASPHAARLCAMLQTDGKFTARGAGAALRSALRDTGRGTQQGGGAFDLERALAGFGVFDANHAMLALL